MFWKYQPSSLVFTLASIAWVLIISSFSTSSFGANKTASYIEVYLRELFPTFQTSTIHLIHIAIRKLGHFIEFGIFSALIFGIFAAKKNSWKINWLLFSTIIVIIIALLDEYHQSFVRNRSASLQDSLVDILGGLTALLILFKIKKTKFNK
ncbi:MAG: VanZ family protein [Blastocatellia bacterium]|nr:VanZ family protein [Blastocatellia bacterium]MBL8194932.1 VanZ family protein [Blastocatellia bacterium]MBN8723514.1 VanZ family protein [Acidobacteriota bacterium]